MEQEFTDHQEIQQSIQLLDRSTSWFRWNTIGAVVLLMVVLAVLFVSQTAQQSGWQVPLIVPALLIVMLISNGYALHRQRHFKHVRKRLAEQMQVAIKHRMRADKFYGLSILDPLTGLYNRRFGEESLQKEILRAERNVYDLAVIAMDLDKFKQINDQFGHAAGDLVLREFSRHLRRAIRACDLPIRLGGDEFIVVLPECPRQNVHIILSRLKPFDVIVNRTKITVSYSRGHAQYQVGDTPQTIIQRADKLLYAEKAAHATAVPAGHPEDSN